MRLLQRSTRHFSVTEIGQEYYTHCKAMLVEAEAAQEAIELMPSEPHGTIRLTCPITLLHARVGPMLADFMAECPGITLHLEATKRRVDVIGERINIAIRARPPPLEDSDLVVRVLAERKWCLWSPVQPCWQGGGCRAYLPTSTTFPVLTSVRHTANTPGSCLVPMAPRPASILCARMVTDDMIALRMAALAGVGIAHLPVMMVAEELQQGLLVKLVAEWTPKSGIVHAVFPSRRGLLPSVRKLIDYLATQFAAFEED